MLQNDSTGPGITANKKKRLHSLTLISDEEESTADSNSTVVLTKKKRIDKGSDDTVPLPKPFPLPKHYRQDIETALRNKQMTRETRSAFFTAIASSMLNYKRYPTSDDYKNVAQSIITSYEFLGCKANYGTPEVSSMYM